MPYLGASFMTDDWSARLAAAETTITKVLSLAPNHALAHVILGFVQIFTKRAAQGIAECEQALALDRNLARAHALIGFAKFFLGRGAETEAHINEAFRLSPRDTFAARWMVYVGLAKVQLGADAEAVIWMRRGLDANRNYSVRAFPSRGCAGAARRAGRGAGRGASGTCARSKLHHPPLPRYMHRATIRLFLPGANASLRACGWPGCRKGERSSATTLTLQVDGTGHRAHTGRHRVALGHTCQTLWTVSRRLVAVFAADVEGYSRLMGADEVGTLKGLTERRAILDRLIGEHRGRIANTAGDSVLAEFGSAVDAVQCAVEAQTALAEANSSLAPDRRISFRIGVHIGDVMVRAGDLFGDGVNIAARLQTLANPGGVCISGATYDQVRKVLPMTFVDLGVQQVKNIQEPIRAYQVSAPSETQEAAPERVAEAESPPPMPDKPSIAVLPFQNMSGDPEQEYFADGMVEEIITALSRFKWLFVIARNSSFTFKGQAVDVKEVGRRLGVRYVLEGSVRKASGKVRITGQLIDAVTGAHIWADRFERDLTDIFALQDEVTVAVVSAIQPKLLQTEIAMATRRRPENLTAYDFYLRALQQFYLTTREGVAEAIRLAHRALELDPRFGFVAALAGACHMRNVLWGYAADPQFDRKEAVRLLRLALSLDDSDPDTLAWAA